MPPRKKGGRPTKAVARTADETAVLYTRLPASLLAALDAWADRLNRTARGPQWTRGDVVKLALERAVEERGKKGEAP